MNQQTDEPKNQRSNKPMKQVGNDLEERTAKFAERFIGVAKALPENLINRQLISQGVRAVGSIGANYCEATESESRTDFIHKISVSKKEIKESRHWIRLLAGANPGKAEEELRALWQEAQELLLIFSKIISTAKKRGQRKVPRPVLGGLIT